MRVAFIVTGGVDRSGRKAVIPALLSFIERQATRHELFVYVLRYHEEPCTYPLLGATVHDLGRPEGVTRQFSRLVRALRRDGPFDVLHAYWALPAGLSAALAGRRLGIPCLVTLDSGELVADRAIEYGLQRRIRQPAAVAATVNLASAVTVCTEHMRRLAQARGIDPVVVPIGVDTGTFTPRGRAPGPPWRLMHAASLNPVKDQSTLLAAFRHVLDRVGDVHLDIAGGDTLDGAVQALAVSLGVDRHVTFHGGLPTDELVPLYQRSHLLLQSSRHEAAGVVVLEAAACGVPTVGTSVGYVADWAPERAIAVPPREPRALGEAIVDALADPARLSTVAASAREWTLAHDADWTAARFDRLYHDLARA
jgi:glycosyltransferase involved in cell wall biosynthesis